MNFTEALKETQQEVKKASAERRTKPLVEPDNWLRFFPNLLNDYIFCATTLRASEGEAGVEETEIELSRYIDQADRAWDKLDNKAAREGEEQVFEPWQFLYLASVLRTDAPHCEREVWDSVDHAEEDYHHFFVKPDGRPSFEGRKEFEALYRTSDFLSGLTKALRAQGA